MDFITSIKTCFVKYVDFTGRASRSEFWYFTLFILIISICVEIVDASLAGQNFWSYDGFGPVYWVFNVLIFLPSLAVGIRRLHDINKSGWWLLLFFTVIGIIPLTYWYVKQSDQSSNNFGNPTSEIQEEQKTFKLPKWIKYFLIPFVSFIFVILVCFTIFLEIGYLPSTKVVSGNDLPQRQKTTLINNSIINKNDDILYFYSEGFLSILDGGQLITQDSLISYQKDEDHLLQIWEMKLNNIKNIELQEDGSTFSDSVYKIVGNDQSEYDFLIILLSNENGGDTSFIDELTKHIN
tara:strand:- start:7 stop:888 length:882 start_codon:yes stop_codon:yes gene_type:complete